MEKRIKNPVTPFLFTTALMIFVGCAFIQNESIAKPSKQLSGTVVHSPSGIHIPNQIGSFVRTDDSELDASQSQVSVNYRSTQPPHTLGTISVYPSPELPMRRAPHIVMKTTRITLTDHEFDTLVREFIESHEGAELVNRGKIKGIRNVFGRYACIEYKDTFAGKKQTVNTRFYLFGYLNEKWNVRYQVTHPKGAITDKEAHFFMKGHKWY